MDPLRNSTGRVVSNESEMAGLLNRYFASTFTQEQSGESPIAESIYQGGEEWLTQKIQVGVEEVTEQLGNLRVESGQVWRVANVIPLFKKGSREELGKYRPVSLTSVVGKVLETLFRDQMRNHLDN